MVFQGLGAGLGSRVLMADGARRTLAWVGLLAIGQARAVGLAALGHRDDVWRGRQLRPRFLRVGKSGRALHARRARADTR